MGRGRTRRRWRRWRMRTMRVISELCAFCHLSTLPELLSSELCYLDHLSTLPELSICVSLLELPTYVTKKASVRMCSDGYVATLRSLFRSFFCCYPPSVFSVGAGRGNNLFMILTNLTFD